MLYQRTAPGNSVRNGPSEQLAEMNAGPETGTG